MTRGVMGRIFWAFLKRDALSNFSYKLQFTLDLLSIVFSVATFYFVARLFGTVPLPALEAYGGDYFSFVLIGISFSAYQGVGLHSFSSSIRQEQYLGTLESVMAAPVRVPVFLLASAQWDFLYATLQVVLYLLAGVFFGLRFPDSHIPAALLLTVLTVAAFSSLGVLSAAFIIKYKRGDPVTWLISTASELLGGVFFPVAVLPSSLQSLAQFVPMTHALEGLRASLLRGAGFAETAPQALALAAFTVVTMPLGILFFRKSLDGARREGSLGHY